MFIPESSLFLKRFLEQSIIVGDYHSAYSCINSFNMFYERYDIIEYIRELYLKWMSEDTDLEEPVSILNCLFSDLYLHTEAWDLVTLMENKSDSGLIHLFNEWMTNTELNKRGFITYRKHLMLNACRFYKEYNILGNIEPKRFTLYNDAYAEDEINYVDHYTDKLRSSLVFYGDINIEDLVNCGIFYVEKSRPVSNPALHNLAINSVLRGQNICDIHSVKTQVRNLLQEWTGLKQMILLSGLEESTNEENLCIVSVERPECIRNTAIY